MKKILIILSIITGIVVGIISYNEILNTKIEYTNKYLPIFTTQSVYLVNLSDSKIEETQSGKLKMIDRKNARFITCIDVICNLFNENKRIKTIMLTEKIIQGNILLIGDPVSEQLAYYIDSINNILIQYNLETQAEEVVYKWEKAGEYSPIGVCNGITQLGEGVAFCQSTSLDTNTSIIGSVIYLNTKSNKILEIFQPESKDKFAKRIFSVNSDALMINYGENEFEIMSFEKTTINRKQIKINHLQSSKYSDVFSPYLNGLGFCIYNTDIDTNVQTKNYIKIVEYKISNTENLTNSVCELDVLLQHTEENQSLKNLFGNNYIP